MVAIHFTTPAQAWNNTAGVPGLHQLHEVRSTATPGSSRAATGHSTGSASTAARTGSPLRTRSGPGCRAGRRSGASPRRTASASSGPDDCPAAHQRREPRKRVDEDERVALQPARRGRRLSKRGGHLPGAGTAITNPSAISAWQASAHTMNSWGQAYQTNSGAGVIGSTPYGPGVFQGTALTVGAGTCARYYRHFHSEQGRWIQNTGTKYDLHYISELIYTETDPNVAYAQSDQCWLLDGLWMAGGNAPSVGLQGPGDPHPGQGKNRLVQPDLMERWQDSVFSFHIKDLTGAERPGHVGLRTSATTPARDATGLPSRRTAPVSVGDRRKPRHRSVPGHLRAVPPSGVPRVPVRTGRDEQHGHEQRLLAEALRAGVRHVRQARARSDLRTSSARRSRSRARTPSGWPRTGLPIRLRTTWSSTAPRSATVRPGPECPPELKGGDKDGKAKSGTSSRSTATRARGAGSTSRATRSPTSGCVTAGRSRSTTGRRSARSRSASATAPSSSEYVIQPEDAGHWLSVPGHARERRGRGDQRRHERDPRAGQQTDAQVERT